MSNTMTNYQAIVAASRYSRWDEEKQRRETWAETVARMVEFWKNRCDLTDAEAKELRDATTNLQVMSSMRGLWTAGKALDDLLCQTPKHQQRQQPQQQQRP